MSDWVSAFEQARAFVREAGLDEVLGLPPERLVAGLQAWKATSRA